MNANDRSIVGLVMVAHAMVHTYEMSIPILVTIWLLEFGVTEALLGVVVTVGYGLFGVGALPGGVLADRFGSRRLIVVCLLGMAGSFVLLGLAGAVPLAGEASVAPGVPSSVLLITLALLLWGVAASVYHPAGLSLISTGVEERGRAFAYHGIAGNLGIALGPLATILLLEVFDWRIVVATLAIPAVLGAIYAVRVDVEERATVTTDGGDRSDEQRDDDPADGVESLAEFTAGTRRLFASAFVIVFAVAILSGLVYRGTLTFLPEILAGLPLFEAVTIGDHEFEAARYAYVGILMIGVVGQYAGGRLTDRLRPEVGLAGAFAVLTGLVLVFLPASAAGPAPLLVVAALLGIFLFAVQPMYQAAVAEYTPAGARGLSYGYAYLGVFGFGALGGAIAGWLLTNATVAVLFVVLAGFAALAAAIAAGFSKGLYGR